LILKGIIVVFPCDRIAPVFAIISPHLLRKLNMVSDAVSDAVSDVVSDAVSDVGCLKWPKKLWKGRFRAESIL
jgi:hypothetical protein